MGKSSRNDGHDQPLNLHEVHNHWPEGGPLLYIKLNKALYVLIKAVLRFYRKVVFLILGVQ